MSVTPVKYTGSGVVASSDTHYVKYVGKTKSGVGIKIVLASAICLSNPDWAFAEKDDTVPEIEFTGQYDDEDLAAGDRTEPWDIEIEDNSISGTGEILLGVGKFYVGTSDTDAVCVGLTRGGGSFVVEREYRNIKADGDPGPVEGRIQQEGGIPKLKMKTLQWLTKIPTLYAGMKAVTSSSNL